MSRQLILLRHGQTAWNLDNRFTGWTDVELTEEGRAEARAAGEALRQEGFAPDVAFTSVLKRAVHTHIPTGVPLIYELEDDLLPVRHYYLGDAEAVAAKAAAVAAQVRAR